MGWVGHLKMSSEWAHGMCFDPPKILEQYLAYFKKYLHMTFAEKSHFWVIFTLFKAFSAINGVFKAFST